MSLYELAESRGSLPLLCYLNTHGPSKVYALVRGLKYGREAVEHAIRVTNDLGLCVEDRSETFPFSRTVSLTPKGTQFLQTPLCQAPSFFWGSHAVLDPVGDPPKAAKKRSVRSRASR